MKINYLAVFVCGVLYWLLGSLWYGVLFGQRWMDLEGITMAQANIILARHLKVSSMPARA